jgi:hypothetical protein
MKKLALKQQTKHHRKPLKHTMAVGSTGKGLFFD